MQTGELPQLQTASGPTGGSTSRSFTTNSGPVPDPPSPPGGGKNRDIIRREAQDAINAILPPKEWTEDDQIWRQLVLQHLKKQKNYPILHFEDFFFSFLHSCIVYFFDKVSSTPATRLDVLALQEQLDSRLKQRQAREIGICPIRRELYSQCFGTRTNLSITINSRHIVLRKENHLCRRTD